jgi:hypothetical protein
MSSSSFSEAKNISDEPEFESQNVNDRTRLLADHLASLVASGRAVEQACRDMSTLFQIPIEEIEQARFQFERQTRTCRFSEIPPLVVSEAVRRTSWYAGPQANDRFWPAVRSRLGQKLDDVAMQSIHSTTDRILSVMPAPGSQGDQYSSLGLALGYVQSGKTTNFISLISKAADRGYRIFIVLSGLTDNLRAQTQDRVDEILIGDETASWHQLTTEFEDFHSSPVNAAANLSHTDMRFIGVVKKNPARLRRLNEWLTAAGDALRDNPVLIVDDEADQASLNSARAASRRTMINRLINEILKKPKVSYVAYTATPFANLLQDPNELENLYPRDFIVPLPEPVGYFGAEKLFGREDVWDETGEALDGLDLIRYIPDDEAAAMVPGKGVGAVFGWDPTPQPEFREAINWFVIATATRRARGEVSTHSTMLVHTSMLAEAHVRLSGVVKKIVSNLVEDVSKGNTHSLRALYEAEKNRVDASEFSRIPTKWDLIEPWLLSILLEVRVIVDNYRSHDRLSYGEEPSVSIVIGGNTLSRGLTLEGLCSSYFVRAASAYDTLLQMGRWFGYRFGYEDLCRIWMTSELASWFRDLALVEAEIRRDMIRYDVEELTPLEVAVRIRTHPAMAITSAARMRAAIKCKLTYSGLYPQTTIFKDRDEDRDWLAQNITATRALITKAIDRGHAARRVSSTTIGISQVGVEDILKFIDSYNFHEEKVSLQRKTLDSYIRGENEVGSLLHWNIVIKEGQGSRSSTLDLGLNEPVKLLVRRPIVDSKPGNPNFRSMASQGDRSLDMGLTANALAEKLNTRFGSSELKDERILALKQEMAPNTGLIVIYPIARDSLTANKQRLRLEASEEIVGLTFYFPYGQNHLNEVDYLSVDLSAFVSEDVDDEMREIDEADSLDSDRLETEKDTGSSNG